MVQHENVGLHKAFDLNSGPNTSTPDAMQLSSGLVSGEMRGGNRDIETERAGPSRRSLGRQHRKQREDRLRCADVSISRDG